MVQIHSPNLYHGVDSLTTHASKCKYTHKTCITVQIHSHNFIIVQIHTLTKPVSKCRITHQTCTMVQIHSQNMHHRVDSLTKPYHSVDTYTHKTLSQCRYTHQTSIMEQIHTQNMHQSVDSFTKPYHSVDTLTKPVSWCIFTHNICITVWIHSQNWFHSVDTLTKPVSQCRYIHKTCTMYCQANDYLLVLLYIHVSTADNKICCHIVTAQKITFVRVIV